VKDGANAPPIHFLTKNSFIGYYIKEEQIKTTKYFLNDYLVAVKGE
jgi:hypothetical protein